MFLWLADWWDSADLWLTQLAFPFQFAVVIAVLGPLCLGLAWLIDRCVDIAHRERRTARTAPPALGRADVPPGTPARIITSQPPMPVPAPSVTPAAVAAAARETESAGS